MTTQRLAILQWLGLLVGGLTWAAMHVVGYGLTADAYHMTAPDPEGRGVVNCMRMALRDAGLGPEADIPPRNPDPDQLRKINEVVDTLVRKESYCAECANELLKYVSSLLAREK